MTPPHYLQTGQRICHGGGGPELACESSGQDASLTFVSYGKGCDAKTCMAIFTNCRLQTM